MSHSPPRQGYPQTQERKRRLRGRMAVEKSMSTYEQARTVDAHHAPRTHVMSIYGKTAIYDEHLREDGHLVGAHCGRRCSCCSWQGKMSTYGGGGLRNGWCVCGLDAVAPRRLTELLRPSFFMPPGYAHRCWPLAIKGLALLATKAATASRREAPKTVISDVNKGVVPGQSGAPATPLHLRCGTY